MSRNDEVYLDASVLVASLTNDPLTSLADAFIRTKKPILMSAILRQRNSRLLSRVE